MSRWHLKLNVSKPEMGLYSPELVYPQTLPSQSVALPTTQLFKLETEESLLPLHPHIWLHPTAVPSVKATTEPHLTTNLVSLPVLAPPIVSLHCSKNDGSMQN